MPQVHILRTGVILYVLATSSIDMWQLAILILCTACWAGGGGDAFLRGGLVFRWLHTFSRTATASLRPRSQPAPVSIHILSHENLRRRINSLWPSYVAIRLQAWLYQPCSKQAIYTQSDSQAYSSLSVMVVVSNMWHQDTDPLVPETVQEGTPTLCNCY
jgi:hypothetical protein